jgi:hypothetical protein
VIVRIGEEYWAIETGKTLGQKYRLSPEQLPAALARLEAARAERHNRSEWDVAAQHGIKKCCRIGRFRTSNKSQNEQCTLETYRCDHRTHRLIPVSRAQNAAPTACHQYGESAGGVGCHDEPTARNIRFQFDGIPYSDVVERFAQMSGKPLVANTNIQGTLSYNDPKTYTYAEALDVINVILAMKDVMLVESGNHLQLVPFKQLPQQPLKILRGTDRTGDVRPGEVVTVVLDLKSLDAKEVADSIVPMLSNAGSVAPLSRGRGLILTDRLQNIERIKYLLAQIDTEASSSEPPNENVHAAALVGCRGGRFDQSHVRCGDGAEAHTVQSELKANGHAAA